MGNIISTETEDYNYPTFLVERVLNQDIYIGFGKYESGIKYYLNKTTIKYAKLSSYNTNDNKITFHFDDNSTLEFYKENGKTMFRFTSDKLLIEDSLVLPYKTMGFNTPFDEIAKLK
jgi:hypothetical protein